MGLNAVVAFIAGLTFWSSMGSHLPVMTPYLISLGGREYIGWVMAAFAGGLILCRSALGRFADRYGRRRSMQLGLTIAATVPLLYYLLPQVPIVIALRPIHALAVGAFATGYAALMGDIAPPHRRGQVIGFLSLVNPLGLGIGPGLGDFLRESLGYGATFMAASSFATVGLVCTLFIQDSYCPQPQAGKRSVSLWQLIASPRVRAPAFVLLAIGLVFGIVSTYLPPFIDSIKPGINAGTFYVAASLAQFIFRVPVASLGDRYGRGLFICFALVCYTLAMVLIALAQSPPIFLIAALIDGVAAGTAIPTVIAWVTDRTVPEERGMIIGTVWLGFDVGIATSAAAVSKIQDLLNLPLFAVFLIAGLISLSALVVFALTCSDTRRESLNFALGRAKDKYAIGSQT